MAGGWVAIIVILVVCLFGAAFYFFGDESSKSYTPVSAEVEGYTSIIQKYAKFRLALQGYNFGSGYIDWAVKKDKGYTVQNASDYSDMMTKKNDWSSYGDKQYVAHVLRYYPFGNYNYGVGNTVIVNITQAQVGNKGVQKFWSWYGFKSHVEWCACFVSWCAEEGGYINSGTIPKFSFVPDGVNWFKSKGQWQKRTYEPSPGDIIFFDWERDGGVDHVGLVKNCENEIVNTIEGNSGDQCNEKSYAVGSSLIFGYGIPKY